MLRHLHGKVAAASEFGQRIREGICVIQARLGEEKGKKQLDDEVLFTCMNASSTRAEELVATAFITRWTSFLTVACFIIAFCDVI